jgi:hypothetical protein
MNWMKQKSVRPIVRRNRNHPLIAHRLEDITVLGDLVILVAVKAAVKAAAKAAANNLIIDIVINTRYRTCYENQ